MDLLFEIYYDSIFIFYYMYSEISIIALRTSPAGLRVQKFDGAIAPRVLKFDSGFAAEGCGGRLYIYRRRPFIKNLYNRPAGEEMQSPFGGWRHHLSPAVRWGGKRKAP